MKLAEVNIRLYEGRQHQKNNITLFEALAIPPRANEIPLTKEEKKIKVHIWNNDERPYKHVIFLNIRHLIGFMEHLITNEPLWEFHGE